jgi:hypothetical protein
VDRAQFLSGVSLERSMGVGVGVGVILELFVLSYNTVTGSTGTGRSYHHFVL